MNEILGYIFTVIAVISIVATLMCGVAGLTDGMNEREFSVFLILLFVAVLSTLSVIHLTNVEKPAPPTKRVPIITTNQVIVTNWVNLPTDNK